MARSIRIQYEGAFYHVMARGNQQQVIFVDDNDRRCFLSTLGDVCEMTGWRVHAWTLMDNHYHLCIQTPEANLVDGMTWLQNTYTRRFNVHHKAWGRLFGDRYKAILVEGESRYHYETLVDYIHLNSVRAGLIRPENQQSVLDYPWSSIVGGYALQPSERKAWMACNDGLKAFGCLDTPAGRREMVERLDRRAFEEMANRCNIPTTRNELDSKQNSHPSQGWYWGSQEFSKKILLQAEDDLEKERSPAYQSSAEHKAHGLQQAEKLLHEGLARVNLSQQDLLNLSGSDPRKIFIALLLRKKTTVSNGWLAEQLKMKSAGNVSHRLKNVTIEKLSRSLSPDVIDYMRSQGFNM
ncbi:MAG TPA: transposase [Chthoniobacterales bacterium]|nr:transposase [Chthoniobacterales bacterium]